MMRKFAIGKVVLVLMAIAPIAFADTFTYTCVDPNDVENVHEVTIQVNSDKVGLNISHDIIGWRFEFSGTIDQVLDAVASSLLDGRRTFFGKLKTINVNTRQIYLSNVPIRIKEGMMVGV